jgi:hypothetical protein
MIEANPNHFPSINHLTKVQDKNIRRNPGPQPVLSLLFSCQVAEI